MARSSSVCSSPTKHVGDVEVGMECSLASDIVLELRKVSTRAGHRIGKDRHASGGNRRVWRCKTALDSQGRWRGLRFATRESSDADVRNAQARMKLRGEVRKVSTTPETVVALRPFQQAG